MGIDATAIAWYAAICGILSAFAPALGGRAMHVCNGATVGIAAATRLPIVESGLAY